MTNEQAAKHFAALPPNESAVILVADGDLGFLDEEPLKEASSLDEEFYDDFSENRKKMLAIQMFSR
jgi:hypothetical protein